MHGGRDAWKGCDPAAWLGESHEGVTFYLGRVFHSRKHPVKNVFTYPMRFAVVDLDAPPKWFISSGQVRLGGWRGG